MDICIAWPYKGFEMSNLEKYQELKQYLTPRTIQELLDYIVEQEPDTMDIIAEFMEETRPEIWNDDDAFEQSRGM